MKTLDQVIEEKMRMVGLTQLSRTPLGDLMMSLQDSLGLNMYDQQELENKILDFTLGRWNDRMVLRYLEIDPQELADNLDPLQTEQEMCDYLLGDVLVSAMGTNEDNFPAQLRINSTETNWRIG